MKIKVALAQIDPDSASPRSRPYRHSQHEDPFASVRSNLKQAILAISQAADAGADLVVFPEFFLQGILDGFRQHLASVAEQLCRLISSLAESYHIAIAGTVVHLRHSTSTEPPPCTPLFDDLSPQGISKALSTAQSAATDSSQEAAAPLSPPLPPEWSQYLSKTADMLEENPNCLQLVNEAVFYDQRGQLSGRYIKRNLWHPERQYLQPGVEDSTVFETEWARIGFLICWDISHPAAAQGLVQQGADIILMPTYWLSTDSEPLSTKYGLPASSELNTLHTLCAARAYESECAIVMVNAGGSDGAKMGGSGVWMPLLGKMGGTTGAQACVTVVDLDLAVLNETRALYKIRDDWTRQSKR